MTIIQHGRIQATEQGQRNETALALPTDGTTLGVVGGVQSGLALTKTSGMGWQLGLGRAAIAPATAANGPVAAVVTVPETGTFAPGDATRDRIDVVALMIDETATIANGLPPVKTVVLQGTYPLTGTPVRPTVPGGYLELWEVPIKAGTSAGSGGWDLAAARDIRPRLYTAGAEIAATSLTSVISVPTNGTGIVGQATVRLPAGRRIRVNVEVAHYGTIDTVVQFVIRRGDQNGPAIRKFTQRYTKQSEGQGVSFQGRFETTSAGDQQITVTAKVVVGSGGFVIEGVADNPAMVMISDMGPV